MALLVLAALLVGQLHQSGAIGLMLLPVAIGVQFLFDGRHRARFHLGRPSIGEAVALAIALGLNLMFWVPYLTYLARLPAGLLANRPTLEVVVPDLLLRIEAQVIPLDLLYFFDPHRNDFLRSPVRFACFYGSVVLGAPLLVYGLWRWLRSMVSVPVFGIWWWCVIAAFALARIPCYPFYVLALAPITALLAAGAFDGPSRGAGVARTLVTWRLSYVAALLALTIVTEAWLTNRGGAAGDYGITYLHREAQARSIVSRLESQPPSIAYALGEMPPEEKPATLACGPVPVEVNWIVRWLDQKQTQVPQTFRICDAWLDQGNGLVYRWTVRE